jgi:hypothetical protein
VRRYYTGRCEDGLQGLFGGLPDVGSLSSTTEVT